MRGNYSIIEQLESRTLLSGSPALHHEAAAELHAHSHVMPAIKHVAGPTLHLTAGQAFSGKLGFYSTPVLDPPDGYSATINWGEGAAVDKASLDYGSSGGQFGEIISGAHAYARAGTYHIKVTFVIGPIVAGSTLPTTVLEIIDAKAIVQNANSQGGVTIHPIVGKKFTAVIGNFSYIAPGIGLTAQIDWGDGKASTGEVKSIGVQGIDVIHFEVSGTHTYNKAGTFPIVMTIRRPQLSNAIIETIDSTAIVTALIAPV